MDLLCPKLESLNYICLLEFLQINSSQATLEPLMIDILSKLSNCLKLFYIKILWYSSQTLSEDIDYKCGSIVYKCAILCLNKNDAISKRVFQHIVDSDLAHNSCLSRHCIFNYKL